MNKTHHPIHVILTLYAGALGLALFGTQWKCTTATFERTTYSTLAASKATIDATAKDYNAGVIPQTAQIHDVLAKAQQAHNSAVDAFKAYLYAKAGLQAQDVVTAQDNLDAALQELQTVTNEIIALVKGVKSGSNASTKH